MLARQRPSVPNHSVCRFRHECAEILYAIGCFRIEVDARVNTGIAKMPVKRANISVLLQELVKIAQVIA
jgi:hypothetical protein